LESKPWATWANNNDRDNKQGIKKVKKKKQTQAKGIEITTIIMIIIVLIGGVKKNSQGITGMRCSFTSARTAVLKVTCEAV
jgi:hypothetical protein